MDGSGIKSRRLFAQYAMGVVAYNIFVILWGAYVRASGSGEGCGDNWPFCNGYMIPHSYALKTLIEFLHRSTSAIDTVLVVGLCAWAFYLFPKRHLVRRLAIASIVLLLVEAALGAGLVLLRLNPMQMAWYLSAHLTNTMLLLGVLVFTAWVGWTGVEQIRVREVRRPLLWALPVTLLICIAGAFAALGDTLFPAISFSSGFHADFSGKSNTLLRLRLTHPAFAVLGAVYLVWAVIPAFKKDEGDPERTAAVRVLGIVLFQLVVGAMNIALLTPIWMQIFHLLMADLLWLAVLLVVLENGRATAPQRPADTFRWLTADKQRSH